MSIVVDCSVSSAWVLPDEYSKSALSILERVRTSGAVAPAFWVVETWNVLVKNKRAGGHRLICAAAL